LKLRRDMATPHHDQPRDRDPVTAHRYAHPTVRQLQPVTAHPTQRHRNRRLPGRFVSAAARVAPRTTPVAMSHQEHSMPNPYQNSTELRARSTDAPQTRPLGRKRGLVDLVQSARAGDTDTWTRLVQGFDRMLRHIARSTLARCASWTSAAKRMSSASALASAAGLARPEEVMANRPAHDRPPPTPPRSHFSPGLREEHNHGFW
jgi:hypothetical protein